MRHRMQWSWLIPALLVAGCAPAPAPPAASSAADEAAVRQAGLRAEIALSEGMALRNTAFYRDLAISPDGRFVVFVDRSQTPVRLMRHDRQNQTTEPMPGVERGANPFFSADGRWLAYVSQGRLWKVPADGGENVDLVPIENFFGGTWGPDGTIVYVPEPGGGLHAVSEDGGEPKRLTTQGRYPSFLPDGHTVLFSSFDPVPDSVAILDIRTGEIENLPLIGRAPRFSRSGHLIVGAGHHISAVEFDPDARRIVGDPHPLVPDVGSGPRQPLQFDVSEDGTLVYIAGGMSRKSEFVRVGLDGAITPVGSELGYYFKPRLSPDGSRMAFEVQEAGQNEVWVADADGGGAQLVSGDDTTLLEWMPDGMSLLVHRRPNPGTVLALPAKADALDARVLFSGAQAGLAWVFPDGPTADGSRIVGRVPSKGDANGDVAMLSADGSGAFEVLAGSTQAGVEHHTGTTSPDGRWLAFVTDKSGNRDVYVKPLDGGEERQVSGGAAGWAQYPHWSPDSRSLYFIQGGQMWRAEIAGAAAAPVAPQALFQLGADLRWGSGNYTLANFDLAPSGDWFLVPRVVGEFVPPDHIGVLLDIGEAFNQVLGADIR